ncbi:hypothetical protein [Paraburkholderia gardini]|uniref:hypothetical protein n=1 Tax=Paraburkholderia gardini TaxID=2823469 RepID=UPI001DB5E7CA|nr:hypothetical protein [Paraburkholderia gardini]CAG4924789.1 hypothetical protein R69919_05241 [Paraburkholderia gardini]
MARQVVRRRKDPNGNGSWIKTDIFGRDYYFIANTLPDEPLGELTEEEQEAAWQRAESVRKVYTGVGEFKGAKTPLNAIPASTNAANKPDNG